MVIFGNGQKTATTTITEEPHRMVRPGHPVTVAAVSFAAAPGLIFRGTSARPAAPAQGQATGMALRVSGSRERLPVDPPPEPEAAGDAPVVQDQRRVDCLADLGVATSRQLSGRRQPMTCRGHRCPDRHPRSNSAKRRSNSAKRNCHPAQVDVGYQSDLPTIQ